MRVERTYLLVVTNRESVTSWAGRPIDLGHPGFYLVPWVIGPGGLSISEPDDNAPPELAILKVLLQGEAPDPDLAMAALVAAGRLDPERGLLYTDLVLRALGDAAQKVMEALMSDTRYEYQSEFARKYFGQGLAEGRGEGREALVRSLLRILDHRGLVLSSDDRKRIESCPDLATLERWMDRALDIEVASDLFDEDE